MKTILITGAGGFIGSHLAERLKQDGNYIIGVDIKYPEYKQHLEICDEFHIIDLRIQSDVEQFIPARKVHQIFHLAADMGGMGYVLGKDAQILQNSGRIDLNIFDWAHKNNVDDILFTSSACRYPDELQNGDDIMLREDMAYPANPQDGYGWEKIFGELLCRFYHENYNMNTHVVAFHNIYGENGTWCGGKEKSPAAICRKVAEATAGGFIEIWGDGTQLRSFCHVSDAIKGMIQTMNSNFHSAINIGTDRCISIKDFTQMIIDISGKNLTIKYVDGAIGVKSRNSDNTLSKQLLNWQPTIDLEEGMSNLYTWILQQVNMAKHD
jgi:nucleoside-diphosphate-sugar epimerase